MTISDINKRFLITISKEEYAELERIAEKNTRSISKQALHYIRKGLAEEKRSK